jgi:hypothetical protein
MLRAAAELTRDLQRPNPWIYWPDFLGSTAVGAALAGVIWAPTPLATVAFWGIAVIALYRATLFIHEITHLNHALLPGFRFVWNLVLGVPTMLPSFMYEGIHHPHTRTRYGTVEDPEYRAGPDEAVVAAAVPADLGADAGRSAAAFRRARPVDGHSAAAPRGRRPFFRAPDQSQVRTSQP